MNRKKTVFLSQCPTFFCCGCVLLFRIVTAASAKIVFCVDDDIYVCNDDGSSRRRLTNNTQSKDLHPRWSPDGKRIAFTRYMDREAIQTSSKVFGFKRFCEQRFVKEAIQTSSEVFIMNADGTNPKRLTHNNGADGDPSWSPDGLHLAFTSLRGGIYQVYVLELASQNVTPITGIEGEDDSAAPDWSLNGTQITYEKFVNIKNRLSSKTIWLMSADGEQQRPLLPDPPIGDTLILRFTPRWSADGQQILFDEFLWRGKQEESRYFVQGVGGRKKEVTDINERLGNNWIASGACWMEADGAMLFSIMRKEKPNPNYDIYRYAFETRSLKRLTREPSDERNPDWIEGALSVSPHGKLTRLWGEIKQAAHSR